jgi:hypothetical protein
LLPSFLSGEAMLKSERWDGALFVAYIGLIWLGMIMGFGSDIVRHVQNHVRPYPFIVHIHAVIFIVWLAAFTVQIALIRKGHVAIHRQLGIGIAIGAGVLLIVGPLTAWLVQRHDYNTGSSDPAFFSAQLGDIFAFAGLIAAGIGFRKDVATHKRLMLLAVLALSTAGFSRWLGGLTGSLITFGHWGQFGPTFLIMYLPNDLLILGMGAYDLITRRHLLSAWIWGATWIFTWQAFEIGLYLTPAWAPVARWLLGH